MGGSNSSQNVKVSSPLGEKTNSQHARSDAQFTNKFVGEEGALEAYIHQKNAQTIQEMEAKQRTREQKQADLMNQEALLQERIEKAAEEQKKALELREKMGLSSSAVEEPAPQMIQSQLTKASTGFAPSISASPREQQVSTARQMHSPMAEPRATEKTIAAQVPKHLQEPSALPATVFEEKAPPEIIVQQPQRPTAPPVQTSVGPLKAPRTQKELPGQHDDAELSRLRAEAEAAETLLKQQTQRQSQDSNSWMRSGIGKAQQKQQTQQFNQASDDEQDNWDEDEALRRSMPGQEHIHMAKSRINTIKYDQTRKSQTNMLVPDLHSDTFGKKSNVLLKNQHMIMLGGGELGQEDQEAQRNRKIDMTDLQSLLA